MSEPLNVPEIYSPVFDYNGNLTTDLDAAIISVINPVGVGTTVNSLGEVVPNPVSMSQASNPSITFSMVPPGKKSPYVDTPVLVGLSTDEVPGSVGIASTHRLSPTTPVIVQTSLRTEFNSETNTLKPSTLITGITTTGTVQFTEQKQGGEVTIDANVTGSVNGISMQVQGGQVLITVPGVGSATIALTP